MKQIHPHRLWLGHAGEGEAFRRLFDLGIEAVVQLAAEEPPLPLPRDLILCHFPLLDGVGNRPAVLSLAMDTTAALVRSRIPTLVCCGAGMSRSPAVAAAALTLAYGGLPEEQPVVEDDRRDQPPQRRIAGIVGRNPTHPDHAPVGVGASESVRSTARTGLASNPASLSGSAINSYNPSGTSFKVNPSRTAMSHRKNIR